MDLVVGRVARSHGVRGELVVDVRTDDPDLRFAPGTRLRAQLPSGAGERIVTVTAARNHSGRLLVSLDQISDRTAADALRGTLFVVDSSQVSSDDDPDAFYDHELEGLPVTLIDGTGLGEVTSVLHLPANDVLAVRTAGGREVLVPFVREIVPTVSADGVIVDPPDGLLDSDGD